MEPSFSTHKRHQDKGLSNKRHHSKTPPDKGVRFWAMVLFCSLLITAGALAYLWQHDRFLRLSAEQQQLQQQQQRLEQSIEPLLLEKWYLLRPQRLKALSEKTFQLAPPQPKQILAPLPPLLKKE